MAKRSKAFSRAALLLSKSAQLFCHIFTAMIVTQMTEPHHLPPNVPFGGENNRKLDCFLRAIINYGDRTPKNRAELRGRRQKGENNPFGVCG